MTGQDPCDLGPGARGPALTARQQRALPAWAGAWTRCDSGRQQRQRQPITVAKLLALSAGRRLAWTPEGELAFLGDVPGGVA